MRIIICVECFNYNPLRSVAGFQDKVSANVILSIENTIIEQLSTRAAVQDFMYMRWNVSTDPHIKVDIDLIIEDLCAN